MCVLSPSVMSDFLWPRGLPGFSVCGIFQARNLEQGAISYSQEIFPTGGSNLCLLCSCISRGFFITSATSEPRTVVSSTFEMRK